MPAVVQRSAVSPELQFLTLRLIARTVGIIDSHGLVVCRVRLSLPVVPRRVTVSVSSIPSLSEPAAPGCALSSSSASVLSCSSAMSWSFSCHAWRSRRLTVSRSRSGRWSSTLRSLVLHAALNRDVVAEHPADRLPEGFGAVDHEQQPLLDIQAAVDQVSEQRAGDRRVLGRAFPQSQRELVALGGDT